MHAHTHTPVHWQSTRLFLQLCPVTSPLPPAQALPPPADRELRDLRLQRLFVFSCLRLAHLDCTATLILLVV
jgi:hypothetical protein